MIFICFSFAASTNFVSEANKLSEKDSLQTKTLPFSKRKMKKLGNELWACLSLEVVIYLDSEKFWHLEIRHLLNFHFINVQVHMK